MLFSESASVAQIAAALPAAARVFQQFGIDCGVHGELSLSDVCRARGLDPSAVRAEIERNGSSAARDWTTASLADLIAHILAKHHEYLKRSLPLIAQRLARVAQVYAEREPRTMIELPNVFQSLTDELSLHMRKEEMMLFPCIEAYEAAAASGAPLPPTPFGSVANPIRMMEHEHENAGGALARMRELTGGYAIPAYACVTYSALMEGLLALDEDLHEHIHLENDILFPRAVELERRCGGQLSARACY